MDVDGIRINSIGAYVDQKSDVTWNYNNSAGDSVATSGTNLAVSDQQDSYVGVKGTASNGTNITINGKAVVSSADYAVSADAFTPLDSNFGSSDNPRGAESAYALARAINASGISGVTASAYTEKTFNAVSSNFASFTAADDDTASYTLRINGQQVFTKTFDSTNTSVSIDDIVNAINGYKDSTGVTAVKDNSGNLKLVASDGRDIIIEEKVVYADGSGGANAGVLQTAFAKFTETEAANATSYSSFAIRGKITLQSSKSISITAGADILGFDSSGSVTLNATGSLESVDISTVTGANAAILAVDAALDTINSSRAKLGAIQSRFESTISNLSATSENLSAARSRIRDADFAAETAELTRVQILQQAGIAMLAQANAVPQTVLALLQ